MKGATIKFLYDEYYCIEVKVATTNYISDTYVRYENKEHQQYSNCIDGTLYVLAHTFDEVEEIVGSNIIEIKKIGIGLVKNKEN